MFDTSVTDELLATTRAVRKRLDVDRAVDPAVMLECIALAQQAPTGSNQQSWRWVVVTETGDESRARRALPSGLPRPPRGRGAYEETDPQTRRVYESALRPGADHRTGPGARDPVHRAPLRRRARSS